MTKITLRIRTQIGLWRLNDVNDNDTFNSIKKRVETEHHTEVLDYFTSDPKGQIVLSDDLTVKQANLRNGDMIYTNINTEKTGVHEKTSGGRQITKDGNIIAQEYSSVTQQNGFRPGMLPLRSMKMQWTLNEFVSMDSQFEYKIGKKESNVGICTQCIMDIKSQECFQNYIYTFDWQCIRVGYLYGQFTDDKKVKVHYIYEPPQDNTDTSIRLLPDSNEENVQKLAALLGYSKVGWIFAHPPREKGFEFAGTEILLAAEQQLEAANGVADTAFVTVRVTINEESAINVEAYQVTKQCMEMVAEGVLKVSRNLGFLEVNPTFTVIVEMRSVKEVTNYAFIVTVPIISHTSDMICEFPKANRPGTVQTIDDLKAHISKAGKQGWTLQTRLADFHLLLFLCNFLSIDQDFPILCSSIVNQEIPIDDGFQIMIRSIAGIE